MKFGNEEFDVVVNSHVLEHVPDDHAAMREMYRIIRPGGMLLLQVPYCESRPTDEDLSITDPDERERRYGQFDHVRRYGTDLPDRLAKAGFEVEICRPVQDLSDAEAKRFGLWNDFLFVCTQPAMVDASTHR